MSCTRSSKEITINNTRLWKVTDTDSGKYVYIPYREAFEYIRFRMDPLEGHGNRIADAYELAEHGFGGRYTDYLPSADILPCIKLIYTNFQVLNQNGVEVFQPFGNWVFDEACKCLQQQTETGRMDLGDGFIVPSQDEWSCIINGMFAGGMNFAGAVSKCAPDIAYPREIIGFLEDSIRANKEMGYPRYNIIRNAHSNWKVSNTPAPRITLDNGLVVPSSDEIYKIEYAMFNYDRTLTNAYTINGWSDILPPESMRQCIEDKIRNTSSTWIDVFKSCTGGNGGNKPKGGKNTLLYVAAGLVLLFVLSSSQTSTVKKNIIPEKMNLFGKLSDLGRIESCYKYLTKGGFGPTESCFKGESTYGKGTATFTATDRDGHRIPSMVAERIMTFDSFYKMMEKNKAKQIS